MRSGRAHSPSRRMIGIFAERTISRTRNSMHSLCRIRSAGTKRTLASVDATRREWAAKTLTFTPAANALGGDGNTAGLPPLCITVTALNTVSGDGAPGPDLRRALSCLDGVPCQECLAALRTSRVRSCLRPVCAGLRSAGPDDSSAWLFASITVSHAIRGRQCIWLTSLIRWFTSPLGHPRLRFAGIQRYTARNVIDNLSLL